MVEEKNRRISSFLLKSWNIRSSWSDFQFGSNPFDFDNLGELINCLKSHLETPNDCCNRTMSAKEYCLMKLGGEKNSFSIKKGVLLMILAIGSSCEVIHVFSVEEFIRFLRMFAIGDDDGDDNDMSLVKKDLTENDLRSFLKKENEEVDSFIKNFGGTY